MKQKTTTVTETLQCKQEKPVHVWVHSIERRRHLASASAAACQSICCDVKLRQNKTVQRLSSTKYELRVLPSYYNYNYNYYALHHQRCRGIRWCCNLSIHPSDAPEQKWCILGLWLLWNTSRKQHAGSPTHRSAWPYDHRKWMKQPWSWKIYVINIKNEDIQSCGYY